ncbi:MAG TPA: glycosyltransferase family 2 protein [Devosia sp.]|nr:glycosyltransferase family 2 protein [Devosia sp.]
MAFQAARRLADAGRQLRSRYLDTIRAIRGPLARTHHAGLPMRIGMTLLVRDEADIVAATIEHALASGVDFIIATDNGSVDGTVEVLEAYRDLGLLELWHEPSHTYEQGRWVTRMARHAAARGASWVINADADEFLWPADNGGRGLKELLGAIDPGLGLLVLNPDHHWIDPNLTGKWPDRAVLMETRPYYGPDSPHVWKVAHRADRNARVRQGNHSADGPLVGPMAHARPIRVMHFPDRGYTHYERKIRNGGSAYAANPRFGGAVGSHWRKDYELLLDGKLAAEYERRQRLRHVIEKHIADGSWAYDFRVRDHLRALLPRALRPDLLKAVVD